MKFSEVKGIIFDLGSTLIEYENRPWPDISYEGQRLAYEEMKHLDHRLPDFDTFNDRLEEIKQEFRQHALATLEEWNAADGPTALFRELNIENPEREGEKFLEIFYRKVREPMSVVAGARQTLDRLRVTGYRLGLISNTIFSGYLHDSDLERYGLLGNLDFRIYSCEFGRRKPHPDIFRAGLEKIGLDAGQTVYVGDRLMEDIEGPRKVGMKAILKYRPGRDYPVPMPEDVAIINELPELLDLLKN